MLDAKIIPQLQIFKDFCDNPNKEIETGIKYISKLLGVELTRSPSTDVLDDNGKVQKLKAVPRDLKEVINDAFLQGGFVTKLIILPHILAYMVRFVQTWNGHIYTGFFGAGWLVDDDTEPTAT